MKASTNLFFFRIAAAFAIVLLALAALPVSPAHAAACTFTSKTSPAGNWSNPASWIATPGGCGSYPGSGFVGDTVVITQGDIITLDVSPINPLASLSFTFGANQTTTLSFNAGKTLNVSGDVTIPRAQSGHVSTLAVGAGTLNIGGNLVFNNSGTSVRHQLTISTGAVNVTGAVTETPTGNTSPTISFSGAGFLRVGGPLWETGGGTLNIFNGSTVVYNGAGDQMVMPVDYSNLTLSGSGEKTMPVGVSVGGLLNLAPAGSSAKANLLSGFIEVGSLKLGGISRNSGTWGSTASGATYKTDVYFALTAGQLNVLTDTRLTPTVTSWPTASGITYGQMLSSSTLTGGSASVPGSFAFLNPSLKPNAGTYGASVVFNPTNSTTYKSVTGNVNVAVAKATASVAVTPYNVTYDGAPHTSTGTALGVNGEDLSAGLNLSGTTHTDAGTYHGDVWTFTPTNTNYRASNGLVSNTITPRNLTLSATGIDKAYDGSTAATVSFTTDALPGDTVIPNYTANFDNKNVGSNKPVTVSILSLGGPDGANYNLLTTSANTTANITPLDITVTGHAKSKFVGTPDPSLTYSVLPALPVGDALTGALTRAAGEAEGSYPIQQGTLAADSNFNMTFVDGSLTIVPLVDSSLSVYINNNFQEAYSVAPGTSNRDAYLGVSAGPAQLLSTNGVPIMGAERIIYKVNGVPTSFTEMMALPDDLLDSTYWLPYYNNLDLDSQLRFANVSNTAATVRLYIGGVEKTTGCTAPGSPYTLQPGEGLRVSCAGVSNGPVKIVSNVKIVAAERVIYKVNNVNTSFSEIMALPNSRLDTKYWLPYYNNLDLDSQLRFANVSNSPAQVRLYIGGVEMTSGCTPSNSPFNLQPGASARVSCAGVSDGPVEIVSDQPIVAAERVIYKVNGLNTSFSEIMAMPDNELDKSYWLPWYNNVALDTQLRFANVGNAQATVHVYINGTEVTTGCTPQGSPFTVNPGDSVRLSCTGIDSGPVRIVSDQPIVAAERVIYKVNGKPVSFSEMMGLPNDLLDTSFWLPFYNNVDLDTQLRFGVPQY